MARRWDHEVVVEQLSVISADHQVARRPGMVATQLRQQWFRLPQRCVLLMHPRTPLRSEFGQGFRGKWAGERRMAREVGDRCERGENT